MGQRSRAHDLALRPSAGRSGALGDLGAHIIDLARYLVGELSSVSGITRTFVRERAGHRVDVDDVFQAAIEFAGGTSGTLEASRLAPRPGEPARAGDQRISRLAGL